MRLAELLRAPPRSRPELIGLHVYEPGRAAPPGAVKLASNENPYGPSPKVLRRIASFKDWKRYPDGSCRNLRTSLSGRLGVKPDRILVGAGSDEIGDLLARAYLRPKDAVIFPKYTFIRYAMAAQMTGARALATKVRPDFSVDLEDLLKTVRAARARMICLANPNNPTGAYLGHEDLQKLLKHIPRSTLLVLDEAYYEYACLAADYPDSLHVLDDHPNLIVLRTFSKIYGLAALRVGYAVAHPEIIRELHKVRPPFNVSAIGQMAAIAALQDQSHVWTCARRNAIERERLAAELLSRSYRVHSNPANFVLIDLAYKRGRDVFKKLERKGVIVRTLDPYGLPHHIRVTVGRRSENDRFLKAMTSAG